MMSKNGVLDDWREQLERLKEKRADINETIRTDAIRINNVLTRARKLGMSAAEARQFDSLYDDSRTMGEPELLDRMKAAGLALDWTEKLVAASVLVRSGILYIMPLEGYATIWQIIENASAMASATPVFVQYGKTYLRSDGSRTFRLILSDGSIASGKTGPKGRGLWWLPLQWGDWGEVDSAFQYDENEGYKGVIAAMKGCETLNDKPRPPMDGVVTG